MILWTQSIHLVFHCCTFPFFFGGKLKLCLNGILFSAKKLDDSMDTAEPLSKKRRVSWIDERMRKPLHEVKYIAKENIGKKAAEAKGLKISKEILHTSNSTKKRMRKFVYSCPPRKLQMNYFVWKMWASRSYCFSPKKNDLNLEKVGAILDLPACQHSQFHSYRTEMAVVISWSLQNGLQ